MAVGPARGRVAGEGPLVVAAVIGLAPLSTGEGVWEWFDHANRPVVLVLGLMAVTVPVWKIVAFAFQFRRDWLGEPSRPGFEERLGIPALLLLFRKEMSEVRTMAQTSKARLVRHHLLIDWLVSRVRMLEEHSGLPHEPLPNFEDERG